MKFGGKCLANLDLIKAVAEYLKEYLAKYPDFKIVAVVSAMGSFTDDSLMQIKELAPRTQKSQGREVDYVTQAGEGISAGLMAIRLNEIGVKAKSLNALQLRICTTGDFQNARITKIDQSQLEKEFADQDILVVTGFQGVHESDSSEIVTLGRGGSDTTAVAIAAVLDCRCEFYKKAKGITAFDPEIDKRAKVLNFMTYQDAYNLSVYGYQFLHPRCLKIAERFCVPLEFKASP
jgi:aspartate kinase